VLEAVNVRPATRPRHASAKRSRSSHACPIDTHDENVHRLRQLWAPVGRQKPRRGASPESAQRRAPRGSWRSLWIFRFCRTGTSIATHQATATS